MIGNLNVKNVISNVFGGEVNERASTADPKSATVTND